MKHVISFILFCSAFYASAETLDIQCKLFGRDSETTKYRTVVSGHLSLDVSLIANKPDAQPFIKMAEERYTKNIHVPLGERSKLFGEEGGTRLQISVWVMDKVPLKPYASQTVTLNGLRSTADIPLDSWGSRMMFNEDILDNPALVFAPSPEDLILEQSPLILPEGSFEFLYSDCRVNWPDREPLNPEN